MKTTNELPVMSQIGVIFLAWRRRLQKRILPQGITLKQLYVLRQLQKNEALAPSHIADMLFSDRPTATYILNIMKRYGWIERGKDPRNLRMRLVRLTETGKEKLNSLSGFTLEPAFDPMGCFTQEERRQFEDLLSKLFHHIKTMPDE